MESLSIKRKLQIRDDLVSLLRKELLGPGNKQEEGVAEYKEVLDFPPSSLYITGVIYPFSSELTMDEINSAEFTEPDEEKSISKDDEISDKIQIQDVYRPSSFGLNFLISAQPKELKVGLDFGLYFSETIEAPTKELNTGNLFTQEKQPLKIKKQNKFKRRFCSVNFSIPLEEGALIEIPVSADVWSGKVYCRKREVLNQNGHALLQITLMVVNTWEDKIYQPRLTINSEDNNICFHSLNELIPPDISDEEKNLGLLFRKKPNFATGMRTSAEWDIDKNGHGSLWNEFLPVYEVPNTEFNLPEEASHLKNVLSMFWLSDLSSVPKEDKVKFLTDFVGEYGKWIQQVESKISDPTYISKYFLKNAEENLKLCKKALNRMKEGVKILRGDAGAYKCFELTNRAMLMQQEQRSKVQNKAGSDFCKDNLSEIFLGPGARSNLLFFC